MPSSDLQNVISDENPRWLWGIPEFFTLASQDPPKRRSRGHQDAPRGSQEDLKTAQDSAKTRQDRAKTVPKTVQDASRRFQNGSRRLKRVPKRLKTPQRRPKTVPRLPKTVKSSKSCFFFFRRMQFRLGKSVVCEFYDYKKCIEKSSPIPSKNLPKMTPRRPKMAPRRPKTAPRRLKDASKTPQSPLKSFNVLYCFMVLRYVFFTLS